MAKKTIKPEFDPDWNARRWLAGGGLTASVFGILALISHASWDAYLTWAVGVFWAGIFCGGGFLYINFIAMLRHDVGQQIRNATGLFMLSLRLPLFSVGFFTIGLMFTTAHFLGNANDASTLVFGMLAFSGLIIIYLNRQVSSVIAISQSSKNVQTRDSAVDSTQPLSKSARNPKHSQSITSAK